MKLIITEKASVAVQFSSAIPEQFSRKNGYFESDNYIIVWCVGHLITMSYPEVYDEKMKKWSLDTIPFIPTAYKYEIIPSVRQQYDVVTKMMNRSDLEIIYYAGDSAREGEYIQRLIRMYGGRNLKAAEKRIWINSQTDDEILKGIREAKDLSEYDNLSTAGYLRAQEDYLFGINLSRALTIKYGDKFNMLNNSEQSKPISVGRVMTFVLGMVVDRERLVRGSQEIPFYGVRGCFVKNDLFCDWKASNGSEYFESPLLLKDDCFKDEENAKKLCQKCNLTSKLTLSERNIVNEKKYPQMLFDLSELQGVCSSTLKISPSETLEIAQSLYEKKMTTYPRVDANVLSSAVAVEIHKNILGLKSLSSEINEWVNEIQDSKSYKNIANSKYVDDSKISDHYAIIPTGKGTECFVSLSEVEKEVYLLIVKRFLSIFYPAAEFSKVSCVFKCGNESFYLSKKINESQGYLKLWDVRKDETVDIRTFKTLSALPIGNSFDTNFGTTEGKTSPPKRYTSGNLVLAMKSAGQLIEDEELRGQIKRDGIGTSSTRAETIKKLVKNGYINLNSKTQIITASKSGELIYEIVQKTVPSLLSAQMTASWEKGLNAVEKGTITKDEYTGKMNAYVRTEVEKIKSDTANGSLEEALEELKTFYPDMKNVSSALICPKCGYLIRKTNWGYGCSNYKNGCKVSVGKKVFEKTLPDEQIVKLITTGFSDKISGFKKRDGGTYNAKLQLNYETGRISPYFEK